MIKYQFVRLRNIVAVSIIDAIGYGIRRILRSFGLWKSRSIPKPDEVKKVILIRLDHIGDLVMTLPAIRAIRDLYPYAELTLLLGRWTQPLASAIPYVNKVLAFSPFWFDRNRKGLNLRELLKMVNAIRKERYDIGIDFRGFLPHILMMYLGGVRYRVGYGVTGCGFLLDLMPNFREDVHESVHSLDLVSALGKKGPEPPVPQIFFPTTGELQKDYLLRKYGLPESFVALNPFAGRYAKEWPLEKWDKLVELILENCNIPVVIFGPAERSEESQKLSANREGVINLTGKPEFLEWAHLLGFAKVVVTNDSAPAHLAGAQGVPTIVIASGINPMHRFKPLGQSVRLILRSELQCYPCQRKQGCKGMKCLNLISPQEVLAHIGEILNETRCD